MSDLLLLFLIIWVAGMAAVTVSNLSFTLDPKTRLLLGLLGPLYIIWEIYIFVVLTMIEEEDE